MSFELTNSHNPLLSTIVRFLHSNDFSMDKIQHMIEESTTEQLVSSFAFLSYWVTSNINSTKSTAQFSTQQSALHLISYIVQKVPPVNLLTGISDLKWGMTNLNWMLSDFYQPILYRLRKVKQFYLHYYTENHIFGIQSIFDDSDESSIMKLSSHLMELETDSAYQSACRTHFKRLILSHAPLSEFQPLMKHRYSKIILTEAIIDILTDLNKTRDATHDQLLYSFSKLFLYIEEFTLRKEIEGQIICESIQSRPFLSPFCLLALVNHIPQNIYLFNLLVPSQLTQESPSSDKAAEIICNHFQMTDLCADDTLSRVVDAMPQILVNYFLSPLASNDVVNEINDDQSFIINLHICGCTFYERMKGIMEIAQRRLISPMCVSASNSQILTIVAGSILKTLVAGYKQKMFEPMIMEFFQSLISMLLPTHFDQIIPKFLDLKITDREQSELLLRMILINATHLLTKKFAVKYLIPYCLKAAYFDDDLRTMARITASKIFTSANLFLPDEVMKGLIECQDSFILLDFIESSDKVYTLRSCKEKNRLESFRKEIISRVPFIIEQETPIFISKSTNPNLLNKSIPNMNINNLNRLGNLNNINMNGLMGSYSNLNDINHQQPLSLTERSIIDYQRIIDNETLEYRPSYLTVRLLSLSSRMKEIQFAENVTRYMQDILNDESEICSHKEQFIINVKIAALPIAQSLLARLLYFYKYDMKYTLLAEQLLNAMKPVIINDKTTLHWLYRFIAKNFRALSSAMKTSLKSILVKLPCYEKFYRSTISEMITLLMKNDMELFSSSDTMCCEYSSSYMHCLHFSVCSILLSDISNKEIVEQLLQPVYNIDKEISRRNVCCTVAAHIATMLPSALSYSFFFGLFLVPLPEYAIESARYFIIMSKIDVFTHICKDCELIIKKDSDKLSLFMKSVMPSFARLTANEEVATMMLCGFLKSLTTDSPKYQQDEVIDAVVLVYLSLGLQQKRKTIIQAPHNEVNFPHELREIIASSLI
ncbi:hypothetical protein M9Y10_008259 [Tritrichomonas musculus]|uniref:Uncharacterized protein n=1 Tax=Tritrichomonas musculus TaxID=1915356 RepID=A0ABR2IYF4_9EUKA